MRPLRNERGFAIPLTVFVVAIVTVMLATLFVRTQVDRRIAESSADQVDALGVAQSGLERYFVTRSTRPADGDSVRLNVYGPGGGSIGYAWVVPYVMRKPLDTLANWMYVVKSTGYVVEPTMGADPQAVRTVAQFAQWQTGYFNVLSTFTAANRIRHRGNRFNNWNPGIDGDDDCSSPNVLGMRVANPSIMRTEAIRGYPTEYVESGTGAEVAALTQVDWNATINGGFIPDYTSFRPSNGSYPSQLINGDLDIRNRWSSGILIVTGDLRMSGSWGYFLGIVLVGGEIKFDATYNYLIGAVVSGLNEALPFGNTPRGDIFESNRHLYIQYNSCTVRTALQNLTGFMPVSNAWVDNWAEY